MSDASSQNEGVVSPVDFVALSAGRMIGRYEVVSVLGQGGFGITYRARDSQLGREVAVKEYLPLALAVRQDGTTVLPRSTSAAEDFTWGRERFVAEGRTLASLQDAPAIVRVFDFLEANGTAYIVMQLLHGETLEARLKRTGPSRPPISTASCGRCSTGWSRSITRASCIVTSSRPTSCSTTRATRR